MAAEAFLRSLIACGDAEAAGELLLHTGMSACSEIFDQQISGRIIRGMVHFRAGDAYRGLISVGENMDSAALLPSTTASRWVERCGRAVAIDVVGGEVSVLDDGGQRGQPTALPELDTLTSEDSQQILLRRGATHVLALPLRKPGGGLIGMVTIEAESNHPPGEPFPWERRLAATQMWCDVTAATLAQLPPRHHEADAQADVLMPVVGRQMALCLRTLRHFAVSNETILLLGPTGSGKSRLARWCHAQSNRAGKPFVAADLTAIPEDLQLAELFGWRKGAFTGAVDHHAGLVSQAEGGTLFLDEIDKLSLKAQAGLLSFIEDRRYHVLGSSSSGRQADVAIICATNANLPEAVAKGIFREDLYYRINVLPVQIPPLDQRRDEIVPWAHSFLNERHHERRQKGQVNLGPEASALLESRPWPGNLRQLAHLMRRTYALALMDPAQHDGGVHVNPQHVQMALAQDEQGPDRNAGLMDLFLNLADRLVRQLRDPNDRSKAMDILGSAMKALMINAANEQTGALSSAYHLLGKEQIVKHRNHQKSYRQDLDKLVELCELLGEEVPSIAAGL
jgi:DNA-binding NtrC family response regulator